MSSYRKNTLVVDFSILPKRPPTDQMEEFLRDFVKLEMDDVRNLQVHSLNSCVFIEMHNAGLPARIAKEHHLRHSFTHNGAKYYIPVYVDGPTTTIRIHDLSPQMSNTTITDYLQQYGKVVSISNEVWKNYFAGVPNGVRVVRMRMEKPVPTYITIENQSSLVTYPKGDKTKKSSLHEKGDGQKQCQKRTSSSAENHTKQPTPPHTTDDNDHHDDIDDDDDDNDDVDGNNSHDATDKLQTTTQRRLSTRTSSDENDTERSKMQDSQQIEKEQEGKDACDPDDSSWRVTRSRKYKKIEQR